MNNITHFSSYSGVFFRKTQAYMKLAFKRLGLSFLEAIVLINVCDNPGIIQEGIANNLALDDAAVARSLKQMETGGLVRREVDESNMRTKQVYATAEGESCKKEIDFAMDHWNSIIFKNATPEEQENIVTALRRLQYKALEIDLDEALMVLGAKLQDAPREPRNAPTDSH
ncbi:MAG: winged helix DNA-binding protein [Clostridiales bacterium]|jgi:DNA-binding MarR family transcriptional regulator|nr:winged helix DNA-binding protein [Clostridiales bacterium]